MSETVTSSAMGARAAKDRGVTSRACPVSPKPVLGAFRLTLSHPYLLLTPRQPYPQRRSFNNLKVSVVWQRRFLFQCKTRLKSPNSNPVVSYHSFWRRQLAHCAQQAMKDCIHLKLSA
jgi:hypothetical protein